jgi:LacI family transcriptional regulator
MPDQRTLATRLTGGLTIRDVARHAGVSRGTVSRVLNNSPRVDPVTRERVIAVIAELDYVPNAAARRLSSGRTGAIGVVVPFMARPSFVERLRGIEAALAQTGYDLVVFNIESLERRDSVMSMLTRGDRVDGLIILSIMPRQAEVERLERAGIPAVLVDAHHRGFSRVVVDDIAGGRLAAEHLLALGHVKIGFLGDDPRSRFQFSPSRLRRLGVRRALRAVGLDLNPEYVRTGAFPRDTVRRIGAELLELADPPTAIVCGSDVEALGVLDAARIAGIAVPGRLSVIGYDDIEIANDLGLTTIHQPLFDSGRLGGELIMKAVSGTPLSPDRHVLPVELVRRGTTGPAPAG